MGIWALATLGSRPMGAGIKGLADEYGPGKSIFRTLREYDNIFDYRVAEHAIHH
jgi:hypothetical protein